MLAVLSRHRVAAPPAVPATEQYFRMGGGGGEPTGTYGDRILRAPALFELDANGDPGGSVPFDTFTISSYAAEGDKTLDVTGIIDNILTGGRPWQHGGIALYKSNGSGLWFNSNEWSEDVGTGPRLTVITPDDTFICPIVFDVTTTGASLAAEETLYLPCYMQFDLSAVTGWNIANSTAELIVHHRGASGATFPCTVSAWELRTQAIVDDPTSLGAVNPGLRDTVAEGDLAAHANVLVYDPMTDEVTSEAIWDNYAGSHNQREAYVTWPEYGVSACRLRSDAGGFQATTLASWKGTLSPQPNEIFIASTFKLDPDFLQGQLEGFKLPGFETPGYFSVRAHFSEPSPANPLIWHADLYNYLPGINPSVAPDPLRDRTLGLFLRPSRVYTWETHVILGDVDVANGVEQHRINGVTVFDRNDVMFLDGVALIQWIEFIIFHGGTQVPTQTIHVEVGPFAASLTHWIGPLVLL